MKILLTQTASIGDVILSTPLIAALQQKHPESEIWFLTTAAAAVLLKPDPRIKGVISFNKKAGLRDFIKKVIELRAYKFDLSYSLQRSARVSILLALSAIKYRIGFSSSAIPCLFHNLVVRPKASHDVIRNLALLQVNDFTETDLKLFPISEDQLKPALRQQLLEPYVAIVPGSLWKTKRWREEHFAELGKSLKSSGLKSIFLGAPDEKQLVDPCAAFSGSISLAGQTSLAEMAFIISKAQAVVCNDSSALHIASAFKIPTTAIFCSTTPAFGFGPWLNPKAAVLENKSLWCRPCARHGGEFCPTGTELCRMASGHPDAVTVEMAAKSVLRQISAD